jgi:hypothetical protein
MSENINLIPANQLPVTESNEVNMLCLENGAVKQKPAKQIAAETINSIPNANLPEAEGEEVNVLCVENGALKQKSSKDLGGASSWNDLKDKPFYIEKESSEHIYAEAVIPEREMMLPEATYELGKTYIVEVDGVREEYKFVSAYVQAFERYKVGFNIKEGNQGAAPADDTRLMYMPSWSFFTKEELSKGVVTCELTFRFNDEDTFVYPANVKVLCIEPETIHHIDPKYIKDMYYSIPAAYTPVVITEADEYSDNLYLDYPLELDKPYTVRVDGVVYSFDTLKKGDYNSVSGYYPWYLGAKFSRNHSMIQWDYPFTIFSMGYSGPRTQTEVWFEDGTTNHTVEFLSDEIVHKLDAKYLPEYDAVIEERFVNDGENETVEATLLTGSYDAIVGRIKANECPRVLCISYNDYPDYVTKCVNEVIVIYGKMNDGSHESLLFELMNSSPQMLPDGTLVIN